MSENRERIAELLKLARSEHDECEDPYYSCPEAPDSKKTGGITGEGDSCCDCGADRRNAALDEIARCL